MGSHALHYLGDDHDLPQRGRVACDHPSSLDSQPGRTVVLCPIACIVTRATTSARNACAICMSASAAKPLLMGPGAEAMTPTPTLAHSTRSHSASIWMWAFVAE